MTITGKFELEYPDAKEHWRSLGLKKQNIATQLWSDFVSWVDRNPDSKIGESGLNKKLLDLYDSLLKQHGITYPVTVVFHLMGSSRMFDLDDSPLAGRVLERIFHHDAVLSLYREHLHWKKVRSYSENKYGDGDKIPLSYVGEPRNLWEDKHGLDSPEARIEFATRQMRIIGFIKQARDDG